MEYPWAEHICALLIHSAQGDDALWSRQCCEPLEHQRAKWSRAGMAVGDKQRREEKQVRSAWLHPRNFAGIVNRGAMQQLRLALAALVKAIGMPAECCPFIPCKQQDMPAPSANPQHLSKQLATLLSSQMIMAENYT